MHQPSQQAIEGFRLSPQQQRLWRLFADATPFRARCEVAITGAFDVARLTAALADVTSRHEILRTRYERLAEMNLPVQVISESGAPPVIQKDLSKLESAQQQVVIDSAWSGSGEFQPQSSDPLLLTVLKLAPERHKLILSLPSLSADSDSVQLLVREIAAVYGGSSLPAPQIQYADYAEWQHELLEADYGQAGRDYWRNQDSSALASSSLPFGKRDHGTGEFQSASVPVSIDGSVADSIFSAAARHDVDASAFLLACWEILLWRHARKNDVVIGCVTDGRGPAELEKAIGLLARGVPFRPQLQDETKFADLLRNVDEHLKENHRWQDYFSWEQWLPGNAAQTRTFAFGFEFISDAPLTAPGWSIERIHACIDRFALKLTCHQRSSKLTAALHYDSRLYSTSEIACLADQLSTLLQSCTQDPAQPISTLNMLSDVERKRVIFEWNSASREIPSVCVHQMFEEQAAHNPSAPALVSSNGKLTYAELNQRANALAVRLQRAGVGPDERVLLLMERCPEVAVAILATLKAGGAYVPLDPTVPKSRVAFILKDVNARAVVTLKKFSSLIPDGCELICLDDDSSASEPQNPRASVRPDNLAYIIYTSGSTGEPKGVAVEHRNLVNYISGILSVLGLSEGASFAWVSSAATDLGNTSVFPALCSGGCLHVLSDEEAIDPVLFAQYFKQHPVDVLKIVPSHYAALLSGTATAEMLPRKRLLLGGEASSWQFIEKLRALAPERVILNHYGPTETTVGVLTCKLSDLESNSFSTVPLGRPLANSLVYILDENGEPVPTGIAGELHIGGAGVARGYWNRPELTAERFVSNRFTQSEAARWYRTGDLARFLSDGTVEFLGRVDHQVKIRGHRVELQEIESVLARFPEVSGAAAVVKAEDSGEKRLIAYVAAGKSVNADAVLAFLRDSLPPYMVPAVCVVLDHLPLLPNGKIDRKRLAEMDVTAAQQGYVPPRTSQEMLLAKLWSTVLGVEPIGIHDNFFDLGGDSILSIQIVARANQAGLRITPRQLFEHQTIAELATVADSGTPAVQADQDAVIGPLPLTPIQRWFFEIDRDPHHYNQSMFLDVAQPLDRNTLELAFDALLSHHDALRLRFNREGNSWRQLNVPVAEKASSEIVDLSRIPSEQRLDRMREKATQMQESLNLSHGPLMRVALFDEGSGGRAKLLVVVHHLAIDGVSWRILLDDLQTACTQLSAGAKVELPPKTTSFKRWAETLSEYSRSAALAEEKRFWLDPRWNVIGALPLDSRTGENMNSSIEDIRNSLTAAETRELLQETPKHYRAQVNEVLLAALAQTLAGWSASAAVLIELEGHGREDISANIDLTRTVGWFTTRFPVLLRVDASRPETLVKSVKDQFREIPNRGFGYGVLRYLADPETAEKLCRFPQPQITFNYLGQFDQMSTTLFRLATGPKGPEHSPAQQRRHLLELTTVVLDNALQVKWSFSRNRHRSETIEKLAANFLAVLRGIISQRDTPAELSQSDFPHAPLSQGDLDKIIDRIRR